MGQRSGASEGTSALRVLIAPDKFKGTLTGPEAAAAMAAGVRAVLPDAVVEQLPLGDGGEGTVEAVLATGAGVRRRTCTVPGPLGDPVEAHLALRGATAVIEVAQACGLQLLDPTPDTALRSSSAGVGLLVREAWAAGATRVILGLGGVACTDGGVGLAAELGAEFLDADGAEVGPGELHRVTRVRVDGLDPRVSRTTFVAATDVTNPLLGPSGAAAVYGPQKGAGPDQVELLDRGLRTVADVVETDLGTGVRDLPGAGAAGGLGWGLVTFLDARIQAGGDLVMDLIGLPAALTRASLVLTGEGKLDAQSRYGKGPVALAARAADRGVPTVAVAGTVDPEGREDTGFAAVWSLVEEVGADIALNDTAAGLTEVTARAIRQWLAA
ncbi:glycerate kinase [Ornithinimicrobium murale]|uniref:glycerate kinase n=1 Tax=Ornithinimicrobium murale TaxID=1050153 RepID=UPI000E0DAE49|nr:glycerate kinase [Ornithinimicrobium murale]